MGGRCRHSLTSVSPRPAGASDADRHPRTSGREPLAELSVTERCNRLARLVTSPLILADRCEECPRLLGKSHRLILPDDTALALNHKQSPSRWRSGSKKLNGRGGKRGKGVSTLRVCWGTWTNTDAEVSHQISLGRSATFRDLRSESCGCRAVASCCLTPPALASRVSPPTLLLCLNWQPGRLVETKNLPKNHLRQELLVTDELRLFVIQLVFFLLKSPA